MIRLHLVVEGQTEERFAKDVLVPHLAPFGVALTTQIVGTSRTRSGEKRRGGGHWEKWSKDIRLLLRSPAADLRVTTLFDLYGLPSDFPGSDARDDRDTLTRADRLTRRLGEEIGDRRFIPYLQRHEFESLVLAALPALVARADRATREGLTRLATTVEELGGPEAVDDGFDTCPARRLGRAMPGFQKLLHGPSAVAAHGLEAVRARCPRFDGWIRHLETLADGT